MKKIKRKYKEWEDVTTLDRKYRQLWVKEEDNGREVLAGRRLIRMNTEEAEVLLKYCKLAKERIVEIGRRYGGSTFLITEGSSVPVISIDKTIKKTSHILNEYIKSGRLTLITQQSQNVKLDDKYDALFVDGDHSYQGVKRDIYNFWKNLTTLGYAIFHDYANPKTPGVSRAINELLIDTHCCKIIDGAMSLLVVQKVKELQ